jgi:hypothetical protein
VPPNGKITPAERLSKLPLCEAWLDVSGLSAFIDQRDNKP